MAQTVRVCEKCGMEEGKWSSRKHKRTEACCCGSRHLLCPYCMSIAKRHSVKRHQRGGGKKMFFKACLLSEELVVAEAMMDDRPDGKWGTLWDRIERSGR